MGVGGCVCVCMCMLHSLLACHFNSYCLSIAVNADTPAGTPNLHIWHLPSGDPVTHFVQKKFDGW